MHTQHPIPPVELLNKLANPVTWVPPSPEEQIALDAKRRAGFTRHLGERFYSVVDGSKTDFASYVFDMIHGCAGAYGGDCSAAALRAEARCMSDLRDALPKSAPRGAAAVLAALEVMFNEAADDAQDYDKAQGIE